MAHTHLAEREGFEPSVGLPLRLISSQVHSTTLPPLRSAERGRLYCAAPVAIPFYLRRHSFKRSLLKLLSL